MNFTESSPGLRSLEGREVELLLVLVQHEHVTVEAAATCRKRLQVLTQQLTGSDAITCHVPTAKIHVRVVE